MKKQPLHWGAPNARLFLVETWDEGTILFNPESGQTHYLNPVAALTVHILEQRTCSPATLYRLLAEHLDIAVSTPFRLRIDGLLIQLEELGLIADAYTPSPNS